MGTRTQRHEAEFSSYVDGHWHRLVRTAQLLGAGVAEAEDLTQQALVNCLVHWGRVRRADSVDAYVHRVLVNAFTAARRRRWTGERPTDQLPEIGSVDPTAAFDTHQLVREALARLGEDQRQVLVLRHWAGLSEAETALAVGVPAGTVKSRYSRGLTALKADAALSELRGV